MSGTLDLLGVETKLFWVDEFLASVPRVGLPIVIRREELPTEAFVLGRNNASTQYEAINGSDPALCDTELVRMAAGGALVVCGHSSDSCGTNFRYKCGSREIMKRNSAG